MGSIEDLAAALIGPQVQQQIADSNPYLQIAKAPDAVTQLIGNTVMQNPGRYSIGEAVGPTLVSGLLSGFLHGQGDEYSRTLTGRYQDAVSAAALGQEADPNDYLPPSLLSDAKSRGSIFAIKKSYEDAIRRQDVQNEISKTLLGKGVVVDPARGIVPLPGLAEAEANAAKLEAEAKAKGTIIGETDGAGYNPKKEAEVDALRKEFSALLEVKNFAAVERAAKVVNEAIKDDNAVSDQELVRYSIQLIEPGMAVREGEQRAVAGSQSIPEEWRGQLSKALKGNSALSANVREGIKSLAGRAYQGHKDPYDRALRFYQKQAKLKNIDPSRISYIGESTPTEKIFGGEQKTVIPDGAVAIPGRTSGGKQVYNVDGKLWVP